MRLTLILLCITVLSSFATNSYSQNSKLTLSFNNTSIENVLRAIEDQSEFRFFYNGKIDVDKKVNVDVEDKSITEVLQTLLSDANITYKVVGRQVVLSANTVISQKIIKVTGKVTDTSGASLPGVTVVIKGTTNGTITNFDGVYSLSDVPSDGIIQFSFVGMKMQEMQVNGKSLIDVVLEEDAIGIEEVVAVGYGTQSKRTLTTSVTKVGGEVLENIPLSSVSEGLKGKLAGVRVYTSNNTPGADASFIIRGGSSINKTNAPLVLVDGIERSMAGINPNDIESINVLKDAASTAIYGARASNGVILVTTKKGKFGKAPRIIFDVNLAQQEPTSLIDFMNATDFINTMRQAVAVSPYPERNNVSGFAASSGNTSSSIYSTRYLNDGETVPDGYLSLVDPLDPTKTLIYQNNNIRNLLYRSVLWQNYYVGIDGGNETISYAASLGYLDDEGVARGTGYSRYNFKANTDIKISEKLMANMGVDFSRSTSSQFANQTYEIARALANPPTQKIYKDDGTPTRGYNWASPNPLFNEYYYDRGDQKNYTSLFTELSYFIFENLKANVQGSYHNYTYQFDSFQKANDFNGLRPVSAEFYELERAKIDAYFSYSKSLNEKHSLSLMGGYSYQISDRKWFSAAASGGSTDKIVTLSAAPNKTSADSKFEEIALAGYFGRFNYDLKKKYLLSATFRYDGSSLFAEGNRWGFFPGVSAGWVMSDEPFMKDYGQISNLKWRISLGQTGNNSIGLYDALGGYSATSQYNGSAGITPSKMPNNSLEWETTTQLDLGMDIGLFENKVNISFDYFNKETKNLLFSKQLPNTTGFSSVQTNIGEVRYYGYDLEISTNNIQTSDFSWNSKLTWSFVKNEVLKLPDNGRDGNRIGGITLADGTAFGGIAEGEPLYRYYGYVVDRILQNDVEAANALYDESSNGYSPDDSQRIRGRKFAGDYEWIDRDGDGKITSKDQFELGVTVPHTTGGLNNSFRYKNITLNLYVDWALGHSINDNNYMRYFMGTFSYNYSLAEDVKLAWKQEGDDTKYARFTADDPNDGSRNYTRTCDVFNYKGDYLCIRDVSLQYRLKPSFINSLGIADCTLTLSGSNLYYFTAVKGISPEIGTSATYGSYNNYPATRRIALGLKVTF